jgi:UTP--glucose-1-phosphate uridylyltransferase
MKLHGIVEKPKAEDAPSNMGVVGRYVLNASIFRHLREMPPGTGGELQLTDGIARLLKQEAVMSWCFDGKLYDCGSKQGYLQATVEFALRHPEVQDEFRAYLEALDLQRRASEAEVALPPMKPAANGSSVLYM